jgi:hypothetical protein
MNRIPAARIWRLERIGQPLRARFFLEFVWPYLLCVAIYYWFFASRFLRQDIVMGGDTQLIWSFLYFNIFSLLNFHEFAWWDPTALNGWPSYFYATSIYASYLSPYTLPVLGLALFGHLLGMSINTFLILHLTLISYGLSLLATMLIARELIRHPLARFLPALIFTLSEISFQGFRDAWLYASMPPALFYLFGLIYYNNRRTPAALIVFVFLTGAFLASLNYAFLQSSLWWTSTFTLLTLLFFPDLIKVTLGAIAQLWASWHGRALLAIGLLFCVSAFAAFFTPLWLNLDHVVRISGSAPIDYDLPLSGDFHFGMAAWPAWTNFLMWSPLPEIHDQVLKFDPWAAGIDHRYLGMVTLPLLFVALLSCTQDRYVLLLFLTFAICALFITYTAQNLALLPLLEHFPILQNIRTMSNTMPREGPSIMIMLLAGLGLDALLRARPGKDEASPIPAWLLTAVLLGLIVFGFVLGVLGASSVGAPVRGALTHMAIYLTISTLLCLVLLFKPTEGAKPICISLLIISFGDLALSASAYWKRGMVWFANKGVHSYPSPTAIGPISSPEQNWPGSYNGLIHNLAGGPFYGIKTWLVLAYRPTWQSVLVNWNAKSRMMTAYPRFQFFSNGEYLPFETIRTIDSIPAPKPGPVHAYQLSADGASVEAADGSLIPIRSGDLTGSIDGVAEGPTAVELSGWAIDQAAKAAPERILVFAGRRLWQDGRPDLVRTDIASAFGANYRLSGFSITAGGLQPDQRVGIRVFALMHDGTARELAYVSGFPFSHDGAPANNPLPTLEESRHPTVQSFYIHDETAKAGLDGRGKLLNDVPVTILGFTPNTVRTRVNAPANLFMLSNDNYDRFWTATVDGAKVPVYRANYTYKAIRLPAGEHVVEWRYNPWPVKVVWPWFYTTLAIFAGTWFLWSRRLVAPCARPAEGGLGDAGQDSWPKTTAAESIGRSRRLLLSCYLIAALLTLAFQIWVRSDECLGVTACGMSFAKGVVWSLAWPLSWVVYIAGVKL